jgi:hypothetical protein
MKQLGARTRKRATKTVSLRSPLMELGGFKKEDWPISKCVQI